MAVSALSSVILCFVLLLTETNSQLAVEALVNNSVFIIMSANMAAGARRIYKRAQVLPMANNHQFILNQYQEVGQKPTLYSYAEKKVVSIQKLPRYRTCIYHVRNQIRYPLSYPNIKPASTM